MEWNINVTWEAYNLISINLTPSCFVKFIISPSGSFNRVIWRKQLSCIFWFVHIYSKTVSTISKKIWVKNTINYYQSIWNSHCHLCSPQAFMRHFWCYIWKATKPKGFDQDVKKRTQGNMESLCSLLHYAIGQIVKSFK